MPQIIKFFAWLLLAVGGTLVLFGHLAFGFTSGWDVLYRQFVSDPLSSILSLLAFVPGGLLYGFGVLLEKWSRYSDAKWAAKQAAQRSEDARETDQAES